MRTHFCRVILLFSTVFVVGISCKKEVEIIEKKHELMEIPKGFPLISFPEGNEFTKERWELGKRLFFDPILSKNNTISCASCHKPELAFSDNVALSLGDENSIGVSNSPGLSNIAYHPYYTRAGGVPTLEMQILVPIQEHAEFNTNIVELVDKLKNIASYHQAALNAYNREFDAFVLTRALANFERSLISGNSPFDQFNYQDNKEALSESSKRGLKLFYSTKTNCAQCHSGFNFTNYAFENNGLYLNYVDEGRKKLTKLDSDLALFKVPSLRNISVTGPYMHDGSLNSLEQVIMHYNLGGANHINKSDLVKPLNLSIQEQKDLVNFLKSLTDVSFITNENFRP